MDEDQKQESLRIISTEVESCRACELCEGRTKAVPGEGNPNAKIMFIGEAPGFNEDQQGRPFIGQAGDLLTKMIEAMGLKREDVFIANVIKCRPPNNRVPTYEERTNCMPFLERQLETIQPEVIVALGKTAYEALMDDEVKKYGDVRGRWIQRTLGPEGSLGTILVMPTYHPAYLLRDATKKTVVWQDLQEVMRYVTIDSSTQSIRDNS